MNVNQMIAVFAVFALVGAVLVMGRAKPAEAHEAAGHTSAKCSGQCSVLPPTEDKDVARMHATAMIVSTYIQVENGNATVAEISSLVKGTEDALN